MRLRNVRRFKYNTRKREAFKIRRMQVLVILLLHTEMLKHKLPIMYYIIRIAKVVNSQFNKSSFFFPQGHSNKYLLLFSLKTKVKNLFDTTTSHGSLNSLHGMRVVAMFFIIWAHMYWEESRDLVSVNATRWLDVSYMKSKFLQIHLPPRSV